MIKHKKAK